MEWTADEIAAQKINPLKAISIAEDLTIEHAPLVSREAWIEANTQPIGELEGTSLAGGTARCSGEGSGRIV